MQNIKFPFQPDFQRIAPAPAGAAPQTAPTPAPAVQNAVNDVALVQPLPAQSARAEHALTAEDAQPSMHIEPDTVAGNYTDAPVILEVAPQPQPQEHSFLALPATMEGLQEFARYVCQSHIVPAAIRNREHDVFFVLARAAAVGIHWAHAFSSIHVIPNPKNGDLTLSMSVAAKAAICIQYGHWEVTLDMQQGKAVASGTRYAQGSRPAQQMSVEYTAYDASLMGRMARDENGVFYGLKTWESRWPSMLKVRALGRLLDALFPDKIGGFVNKEDLDDEAERAMGAAEKGPKARRSSRPKAPPQQVDALTSLEDCLVSDETESNNNLIA